MDKSFDEFRKGCRWRVCGLASKECNNNRNERGGLAYLEYNGRDCREAWCPEFPPKRPKERADATSD